MSMEAIWLLKLVSAHLLTDFVLQPRSWVLERKQRHFASGRLYLHGLVTGLGALVFLGPAYWIVVLIITLTHILIDGWKSYQTDSTRWFIVDQLMHLAVIVTCWVGTFGFIQPLIQQLKLINHNLHFWVMCTAIIFLTFPAGILIGQLTSQWRKRIADAESLASAGKWIGVIERLIVFMLVVLGQFSAISLLVAAKGIIRFNEKDRPEVKTEYLVIGTLMSIGLSMITGLAVKYLQ